MRIGVLGAADSWYLGDLRRAAADRHELLPLAFTRLGGHVGGRASQTQVELRQANQGQASEGRRNDNGHAAGWFSGTESLDNLDAVIVRAMPPGSLEQVVFRMDLLGQFEASGGVLLNRPRAIEIAVDKYLALARLQRAGLPTPWTIVCQTADEAMEAFRQLGRDVVLKPLFGAEGRGITRLCDEDLALRAFTMLEQLGAVLYLQEYLAHDGFDHRLLVIGARVLAMTRRNSQDWRTNVSRGARAEAYEPTDEQVALARQAAEAVGATLAGIDLLPTSRGPVILEVNAAPGWRGLARATRCDVAALVLEHLEQCCSTA